MDYLKTDAPFWKKEICAGGSRWVEAKQSDQHRKQKWTALKNHE
jgi:molybdopterin synthase catalytic subunit